MGHNLLRALWPDVERESRSKQGLSLEGVIGKRTFHMQTRSKVFNIFFKKLFISVCQALVAACGIQFPDQGLNLGPLHRALGVLATGPVGDVPINILFCALRLLKPHQWEKTGSERKKFFVFSSRASTSQMCLRCRNVL